MTDALDERLKEWATPRQVVYIDAVNAYGGLRAAARELGVDRKTIHEAIKSAKSRAARAGYAPEYDMVDPAPAPFTVKRHSQYYNKDGEAAGRWVIKTQDGEQLELAMRAAAEAMAEELPRLEPLEQPFYRPGMDRLLNLYTLTDCHVGMLAWGKESGEPWDLKIAEDTIFRCFEQMVASAPPASIGFVNQLGDFLHSDSMIAVTPTSGHILDQDVRFAKMVRTAIVLLRKVVDLALMKHAKVVVLMAEGNHDMASSVWLRLMFQALYEKEPRVEVIDSELPYYAYQHGETMLAFHHSHLKKLDQFPLMFAAQYAPMWGATTKRYAHAGHRHHLEIKEHGGMIVTQHPTLAAKDAYAARGGWFAERSATAITYHDVYGQVGQVTITPEMMA
jgi:hypothetical protein